MATEDVYLATRRGAGSVSRAKAVQHLTLTVNGNTTVKGSITIPADSHLRSIKTNTPTAITGSPTHTYLRAGATDGGQDYVADTDVKGAATENAMSIVSSIDQVSGFTASDTTIFFQLTTSGGTSSAGPVNVMVDYDAPRY